MPSNSTRHKESLVLKVVIPIASMIPVAMVIFGILIWRGKHKSKSISIPSFSTKIPKVSFSDLARATHGFSTSNLIGSGRYSSVYQGKLVEDEIEVAVKVFNLGTRGAQKSFIAECNALRNVRHRNLVPILTACSSIDSDGNDFKALVFKFMARGDLHKLLYSTRDYEGSSEFNLLTMTQRMNIVVDVAHAVEYLHHNNQGRMVHCDLKPSNILLDNNMTSHVGLTIVKFTEINFPDRIMQIVDPLLIQELELCQETPTTMKEKGVHSLMSMLNIGLCCTKPSPGERIIMQEVAAKLHGIRDAYVRGN